MSWICGFIHKTPDRAVIDVPPDLLFEHHSSQVDVYCGGRYLTCQSFPHPLLKGYSVFILGETILRMGNDYRYPDTPDWNILLADENKLRELDGHWLVVIAGPDGVTAFNDPLCTRSLYIHEDSQRIVFTSHLEMLRAVCDPEIDPKRLGAYWFSLFPPGWAGLNLPTFESWYRSVAMLGTGGKAVMSIKGIEVSHRDWLPDADSGDLLQRVQNMVLLPFRAGRRVVLGLSGGMDIRSLLAVCLGAKVDVGAVHFGSGDTVDYRIARDIAQYYHIPFRLIRYEEAGVSWEQARKYLANRGLGYNPASCDFMGYYPMLADDYDVFISGNQGEFFRFRFFSAYRKCLAIRGPLGSKDIAAITQSHPPRIFTPEATRLLYCGYREAVEQAAAAMPDSREMRNLMWIHLFLLRYRPRTIDMPNQAWMDGYITDHMPFLHASIMSGHWHYGFARQLAERPHRDLVRHNMPSLQRFPVALASISTPYWMPPVAPKLKLWLAQRNRGSAVQSRVTRFLNAYRDNVLELLNDSSCKTDPLLDHRSVMDIANKYYSGDSAQTPALLSLLSYLFGK